MGGKAEAEWQQPVGSLPDELWDVLIVGAGPAGSIAAIHLASQGHRVLLAERSRFPRDKTCGDGLLAGAIRCLERAGLAERVRRLAHRVCLTSAHSPSGVEVQIEGEYLLVKRAVLDALLAEAAAARGATVCEAHVTDVRPQADGTVAASFAGSERVVRAQVGVLATGASLTLARRLGLPHPASPSALGIRCYVRSRVSLDCLVTFSDPSVLPGYGWLFPLGDGECNVGCVAFRHGRSPRRVHLKRAFERLTGGFALSRDVMRNATLLTPLRGARLRGGLAAAPPLAGPNILAVGETIGSTLPLTGEGVGKAMETGEMAAAVIHDALTAGDLERLREYPQRVNAELWPEHLSYLVAQRCAAVPWLNDFIARRIRAGALLHSLATRLADEEVSSPAVSVLRSVFRVAARLKRPALR